MIEAGVIISTNGEPLYWHEPRHSSGALPDSRALWDHIWKAHQDGWLAGFAHSHPGSGVPGPSDTDISTFVAIEQAIGRPLSWWITSADRLVVINRSMMDSVPGRVIYAVSEVMVEREPFWVAELRRRSEVTSTGPYR